MAGRFGMDRKVLASISALVKDAQAWNAFILLLEHEREVLNTKMNTPVDAEELIRINGVCRFIEKLRSTRNTALSLEKLLRDDDPQFNRENI